MHEHVVLPFSGRSNVHKIVKEVFVLTHITASWTELKGLDLQTGLYTLKQIKAATNNFDPENKLGEGGFGAVYKVTILNLILFFSFLFFFNINFVLNTTTK